jgi:hypothetical protein
MAIQYRAKFRNYRVRPGGDALAPYYQDNQNADPACDEFGNAWVRVANAGGDAPALSYSLSFDSFSYSMGTAGIGIGVSVPPFAVAGAIETISAFTTTPNSYLMVFTSAAAPAPAAKPRYCWPCPTTGFQLTNQWPYGLPLGQYVGLFFVFSAQADLYLAGPTGWIQGIITLAN